MKTSKLVRTLAKVGKLTIRNDKKINKFFLVVILFCNLQVKGFFQTSLKINIFRFISPLMYITGIQNHKLIK